VFTNARRRQSVTASVARAESAVRAAPSPRSGVVVQRLFCAWLFFQCFFYGALPYLRWNVGIAVTPDKVFLVAMLVMLVFRGQGLPSRLALSSRLITRGLAAFSAVLLVSWWAGGGDATNRTFADLTRVLNLSVFPALGYLAASRLKFTPRMLTELLVFFSVFGVYLSVTAIAEHYSIDWLIYPSYIRDYSIGIQAGRSRGPFVNTIGNGGMLVVSFLASNWLASISEGPKRVAFLAAGLLSVPAIYFTETRSVWLAFALVTATFTLLRTPVRRHGTMIIVVLALAFLVGVGSKFSIADQTLFSRRQNTIDYRLDNFEIAWSAFKAKPWFGLGFAKLRTEWADYADLRNSRRGVGLDDGNHSTLLGILAELGLAGTVPFFLALLGSWLMCITGYRRALDTSRDFERQIIVLAICAFEVFCVMGLTSDLRTVPTVIVTAFWFVGMVSTVGFAVAQSRIRSASGATSRSTIPPMPAVNWQYGRRARQKHERNRTAPTSAWRQ
jgi:putative inorganic carbon (hco3(-)) transporter